MAKKYRPSDIVFVRHGESVWNAWGTEEKKKGNPPPEMEGRPDHETSLTDLGVKQAKETGKELAEVFGKFDIVYHSPYLRTRETAQYITEQFSYKPKTYLDLNLVEQQFGWLDAGAFPEKDVFVEMQEIFDALRKNVGKFYAKPPNGESWFDVALRTHTFLGKIFREEWDGKKVLVVSHAVTIATFLYHFRGRSEEETVNTYQNDKLKNCGVVHFKHNANQKPRWDLVEWNKTFWK